MDEKLLTLIEWFCREKKTAAVRAMVDAWKAAGRPGGTGDDAPDFRLLAILNGTDEQQIVGRLETVAEWLRWRRREFDAERTFCAKMREFLEEHFSQERGSLGWNLLYAADDVIKMLSQFKTMRDAIQLMASFWPRAHHAITNVMNKVEKPASDAAGS